MDFIAWLWALGLGSRLWALGFYFWRVCFQLNLRLRYHCHPCRSHPYSTVILSEVRQPNVVEDPTCAEYSATLSAIFFNFRKRPPTRLCIKLQSSAHPVAETPEQSARCIFPSRGKCQKKSPSLRTET